MDNETINIENLPVTRLHTSCKTLTVAGFKECYCNKNYQVLIIEGEPLPDELINAWNDIVFEYGCMIKTENTEYLFDLQKRISELEEHITKVDDCLLILNNRYSIIAIETLQELGYDGVYNFDDHVQYIRQLGRIKSLCKTRVVDLQDLRDEYSRYHVSTDSQSHQTEQDFEEWLSVLGRFQHYHINQETTTVTQWAGIINAYIKHFKTKNPQPTDG